MYHKCIDLHQNNRSDEFFWYSKLCKPNKIQNFRLKKGFDIDDTKVLYVDSINQIIVAGFNGFVDTILLDQSCLNRQCNLNLFELGNDNLIGYSISGDQKISIYGPDKNLQFYDDLGFNIGKNIAVAGKNKKYIVIGDQLTQEIYLYDNDFKLVKDSLNQSFKLEVC